MWVKKNGGLWHRGYISGTVPRPLARISCRITPELDYTDSRKTRPTSNLCKKCLKKERK